MRKKQCKLGVLALLFIAEYGFAQTKDSLSKENTIKEVVVVAFGKQKKEEITGSVQSLKAKDLSNLQNGNILQGIVGKVAGVQVISSGQPGSQPTIRMRGIGSINASSDPLIVLDGIPYNGNLNSIAAADIESISFLEDASSNALYGSRGANGVIIVNTKRGKNKGLSIEADVRTGVNFRSIEDYPVFTSPQDYYTAFYNRARIGEVARLKQPGAVPSGPTPHDVGLAALNKLGYNAYNVPFAQLIRQDGSFNPEAQLLYQDNWKKLLFKPALRREATVGINANGDQVKSYTSLNYLDDKGYLISSGFERFGIRSNVDYSITSKLKLTSALSYTYSKQDFGETGGFSNPFQFARNISPFYPVYLRNDNYQQLYDSYGNPLYDYGDGSGPNGASRSYAVFENPVGNLQKDKSQTTSNVTNVNLGLNYEIIKGLDFTYNFGAYLENIRNLQFGNTEGGTSSSVGGTITKGSQFRYTLNHQQLLTYQKKLDKHNFNILIGHELNKIKNEGISGTKQQLLLPNSLSFDNAVKITDLSGNGYEYAVEGYFSRLLYNYDGKYFFNANVRRDGSSVFSPESRWGTFYGLGAAWNVAKEDFLKDNNVVNALKLKVSYGQQGNDNILLDDSTRDYYAYQDIYGINNFGDDKAVVSPKKIGNRNLKWETSKNLNAGFEASFFQNRITLNADYFERKVSDMIYALPLPPSNAGSYVKYGNIGDMTNRGVQANVNVDILKKEDVQWSVYANATHYKNTITKLPAEQRGTGLVSGLFILTEGGDRYTYYLKEFAGVNPENGDALWYRTSINPTTQKEERTITNNYKEATDYNTGKSAIPKVYGGFGTDVTYKRLNLSVNFAYQFGGYGYDNIYRSLFHSDTYGSNYSTDLDKTWTPENPGAALPRVDLTSTNQNGNSTLYLIKSDYISLQDVTLSYQLPEDFAKQAGLSGLKVYLTGNNLYLWSKRKGYDPRASLTGVSDAYRYSLLSSVSLGFKLTF
ncbi:SusC/RagA family TonB-linked outer membrane protein [Chryseobacterium phosphatilyticum]|uniref:SusC/RagA family TonB-linked outer membrane protein n=1 Tax=Chryseobacterium phosphatilyticum TaxID=475075 RepID=A0A316XER8_9FLAO|nr:SusC/RagA family TonB-linked outer membrane protein [Chryseobacterium phosphatilyticum]PWN72197.1 SusC/RagA family TonB-linked outer membrane protein [Chryseobacterium phosphatilyticum]